MRGLKRCEASVRDPTPAAQSRVVVKPGPKDRRPLDGAARVRGVKGLVSSQGWRDEVGQRTADSARSCKQRQRAGGQSQ